MVNYAWTEEGQGKLMEIHRDLCLIKYICPELYPHDVKCVHQPMVLFVYFCFKLVSEQKISFSDLPDIAVKCKRTVYCMVLPEPKRDLINHTES